MRRPSGTWVMPLRTTSWGGRPTTEAAPDRPPPAGRGAPDRGGPRGPRVAVARGQQARHGAEGGGLARAIVAEQRDDLALGDPERDALARMDLAVVDVQVRDLKHARRR